MQGDRQDKSAKGWDEPEKVQPHESQVGWWFFALFSSFSLYHLLFGKKGATQKFFYFQTLDLFGNYKVLI